MNQVSILAVLAILGVVLVSTKPKNGTQLPSGPSQQQGQDIFDLSGIRVGFGGS